MCTSYYLENSKALEKTAFAARNHALMRQSAGRIAKPVITQGEVCLGDIVPVIAPGGKDRKGRVYPMVWGFSTKLDTLIPCLDTDILDSTRNPVVLEAWEKHRCLIPSSWYYEWERVHPEISYDSFGDQTPERERQRNLAKNAAAAKNSLPIGAGSDEVGERYMVQTKGSSITLMAGIYRIEERGGVKFPHFMILTQYAVPNIMFIHNKMPVIFDSSNAALLNDWLNPEAAPPWIAERVCGSAVTDVVYEKSPVQRARGGQPFRV